MLVVSPISLDAAGEPLNVNADDAAAAMAAWLGATELLYLTDVPGVRDAAGVRPRLDAAEAMTLIDAGIATGGMGIKLSAALSALNRGVPAVRIGDARVLFDTSAGTALWPASLGVV
jgi:acetylglutamate kinase